jgi:ADP-ribose pyrophosphatase
MQKERSSPKKAIVNRSRKVYAGRIFDFVAENLTLPNGRNADMAFIRHPGSTAVVPLLDDDTVIMELQYRHPVGEYLLEIPAGTMEPGESPLDCARRELEEETGLKASQLIKLGKIHIIPAYSDEVIHVYIARDLTPSEQNLDQDEIIEIVKYPLVEAVQMIAEGKITDALSILSIQMVWSSMKHDATGSGHWRIE